jgi:hypothetical protein
MGRIAGNSGVWSTVESGVLWRVECRAEWEWRDESVERVVVEGVEGVEVWRVCGVVESVKSGKRVVWCVCGVYAECV